MISHYSQVNAQLKRFLSPDLNISWMRQLYLLVTIRQQEIITARQQGISPPRHSTLNLSLKITKRVKTKCVCSHMYTGARSLVSFSDDAEAKTKISLSLVSSGNFIFAGSMTFLTINSLRGVTPFLWNHSDFAQIKKRKTSATVFVRSDFF